MQEILRHLRFAAQQRPFVTAQQIEQRAKWVKEDFADIGLKYELVGDWFQVSENLGAPYAGYRLLGSECDIDQATPGDRRVVAMAGAGFDQGNLLYFSKISEWAHRHVPELWPKRFRDGLRDPNQHHNTLCELWWLGRVAGLIDSSVEHAVPIDPTRPKGQNVDWRLKTTCGTTLRLQIKRRPGDIGRFIGDVQFKPASTFDSLDKFGPAKPPQELNVGCIQLSCRIDREVIGVTKNWLERTPNVSAVALYAPCASRHETFAVVTQPELDYIERLFTRPDAEDRAYVAPLGYALSAEQFRSRYPGVPLPPVYD